MYEIADEDKIKYVALEPQAWLADDDWKVMTSNQRGIWWMITLELYNHQGRWKYDVERIESLSNYDGKDFKSDLQIVLAKFQRRRGFIYHKRVTKEVKIAQAKHAAAVKAANTRWEKEKERNAGAMRPHNNGNAPIGNANLTKPNLTKPKKKYMSIFELARQAYPGTKRGKQTEFDDFRRKHKDWKEVLPLLLPTIEQQKKDRITAAASGGFVPPWKNFKTWLYQRCWEDESGRPEEAIEDDGLCIVDRKPGVESKPDGNGKNIWLCAECRKAWGNRGSWGKWSYGVIETRVLAGKANKEGDRKWKLCL